MSATLSLVRSDCVGAVWWARIIMVAPLLFSRHRIGYEGQGCSRAIDVVLHSGRSAQPDRPDNFSVHLDGKPSTPRRHTRERGDTGQKRRVALDKVEKVLRGNAEQGCISLVLRNLDGRDRGPIHPGKGLEISAVIENRYVLCNAKFSRFRHRCIHHFLCELRGDAVFLHHVSHLNPPSLDTDCALIGVWVATRTGTSRRAGRSAPGTGTARRGSRLGKGSAAR